MKNNYPEPVASGLVRNSKGEVLLVKSNIWKDRWTIPGGHVEWGERLVDALKREIKEEVGLTVKPTRLISVQEAVLSKEFGTHQGSHAILFDFLCECKDSKVKMDKMEVNDYKWVSKAQLPKIKVDAFTKHTLKIYMSAKYLPVEFERKLLGK